MPRFTDHRIHRLCTEALAAETQEEADMIIKELQLALQEHIKLAKDSLKVQASTIAFLDHKNAI